MGGKFSHKRKTGRWILVVTGLILVSMATAGALAKYTTEMKRQAEMIAADFHISSDLLEEAGKNAEYDLSDWAGGIDIQLYNYEKENVALAAKADIAYTVTLDDASKSYFDYPASGTLGTTKADTPLQIKIKSGVTVPATLKTITVTVTTTSPFEKTLTAKFNLIGTHKPALTVTRVTENGSYYLATITTGQYEGPLTVKWDSRLQPDNTNELMTAWTGTSGIFTAEKFTTYELIFLDPSQTAGLENQITLTPGA